MTTPIEPLLVRADELRRALKAPPFRVNVDEHGVTICTSREHERAVYAPTLRESLTKWIKMAEASAEIIALTASGDADRLLTLANDDQDHELEEST